MYFNLAFRLLVIMTNDMVNKSKYITCDICSKSFKSKHYLKVHKRIYFDDKQHKCDVCDKSFILKSNLTQHMLIHSGKKDFKCRVCFYLKNNLDRHMLTHTKERSLKCDICEKSFRLKSYDLDLD